MLKEEETVIAANKTAIFQCHFHYGTVFTQGSSLENLRLILVRVQKQAVLKSNKKCTHQYHKYSVRSISPPTRLYQMPAGILQEKLRSQCTLSLVIYGCVSPTASIYKLPLYVTFATRNTPLETNVW